MASAKSIQIDLAPTIVLQAIQQMDDDSFNDFFHQVISIRNKRAGSDLQVKEIELLQTIVSSSLTPVEHARLVELGYKLEDETITSDEQAELALLTEKSEKLNVTRLTAVHNLALLRQTTFQVLMSELGLLNTYA